MSRIPCIHIGLPKTATTTLQSTLFPDHTEIEYLGKYIRTGQKFRDKDVESIITGILRPPFGAHDAAQFRELYQNRLLPRLDPDKVPMWSSEGITAGGPWHKKKRAEGFHEVFGECRIIIVLRHPLKFAQSMYFQKLKETQLREDPRYGRAGQYFDIDSWLERCFASRHLAAISNLDYLSTIDAFSEVFGKNSIGIFLFEELVENQERFIQDLCEFIGVDGQQGIELTANQKRNIQLTQGQLELIQSIARSPIRSLLFRFSSHARRRRILKKQQHPSASVLKAKVEIRDAWRARLEDLTRECNRKLVKEWGLSLERFDYPL